MRQSGIKFEPDRPGVTPTASNRAAISPVALCPARKPWLSPI